MNNFYRQTGWSKEVAHRIRVINQPILKDIANKYSKSSVVPKSIVDRQIEENLAADFQLVTGDMAQIATLNAKARFNDSSLYYEW